MLGGQSSPRIACHRSAHEAPWFFVAGLWVAAIGYVALDTYPMAGWRRSAPACMIFDRCPTPDTPHIHLRYIDVR